MSLLSFLCSNISLQLLLIFLFTIKYNFIERNVLYYLPFTINLISFFFLRFLLVYLFFLVYFINIYSANSIGAFFFQAQRAQWQSNENHWIAINKVNPSEWAERLSRYQETIFYQKVQYSTKTNNSELSNLSDFLNTLYLYLILFYYLTLHCIFFKTWKILFNYI